MASREKDGVWYVEVFRSPDGYIDLQKEYGAECLGWYEVQEMVTGHWCLSRISEGVAFAVDAYTGLKLRCKLIRRANGRLAISTYYGDVVAQLSPVRNESENENGASGVLCAADHTVAPIHDIEDVCNGKPVNWHVYLKTGQKFDEMSESELEAAWTELYGSAVM